MNRRTPTEQLIDVLRCASASSYRKCTVNRMVSFTGLNHRTAQRYVRFAIANGLLESFEGDEYYVTDRGCMFLQEYLSFLRKWGVVPSVVRLEVSQ